MSATPRPWKLGGGPEMARWVYDQQADIICTVANKPGGGMAEADENAALIVRSVNAFPALLAVAKAAQLADEDNYGLDDISRISQMLAALTAAYPGWREWTP